MFKSLSVVACLVVILSGCTGTSHTLTAKASSDSSSATVSSSVKPSAKAKPIVPVDQIPPGDPDSWIPAGVSTKAPFRESTDVIPTFRRVMFRDELSGARAMAVYYLEALNWSAAMGEDPTPFAIVCDADRCLKNKQVMDKSRSLSRHLVGSRQHYGASSVSAAPSGTKADFIVQIHLKIDAGKFVESTGKVIRQSGPQTMIANLYMRWSGTMWRVVGDYLAKR